MAGDSILDGPAEPKPVGSGRRWTVYAVLLASMALWGGTWPVGRAVARTMAPASAALLRFTMASAALVALCVRTGGWGTLRVGPAALGRLALLGATGVFGYSFLFFSGLRSTGAGRAALIVGCIPVCIALGAALTTRRRLSWPAVAGIALSLAGVSVVIADGDPLALLGGQVRRGDLMILGCVLCWTAYTLLARPTLRTLSPLVAVTWSCLLGAAMFLPFALAGGLGRQVAAAGLTEWAALAYLGVAATALGYYGYYSAIGRVGPVAAGIFINLVPVFAVALACIFQHEPLGPAKGLGGAMVIAGVVVTVRAKR